MIPKSFPILERAMHVDLLFLCEKHVHLNYPFKAICVSFFLSYKYSFRDSNSFVESCTTCSIWFIVYWVNGLFFSEFSFYMLVLPVFKTTFIITSSSFPNDHCYNHLHLYSIWISLYVQLFDSHQVLLPWRNCSSVYSEATWQNLLM